MMRIGSSSPCASSANRGLPSMPGFNDEHSIRPFLLPMPAFGAKLRSARFPFLFFALSPRRGASGIPAQGFLRV